MFVWFCLPSRRSCGCETGPILRVNQDLLSCHLVLVIPCQHCLMNHCPNFHTAVPRGGSITRVVSPASLSLCGLRLVALCWVGMLVTAGCGSSQSELVSVTGQVTIDGVPVPLGRIEFFPELGGRPAGGDIDSDGRLPAYDLPIKGWSDAWKISSGDYL